MQFHRAHHAVASLNGLLYAVGGLGISPLSDSNKYIFTSFIGVKAGGSLTKKNF